MARKDPIRDALAAFGIEDSSRCPSPAAIATLSESGLDAADPSLLDHLARCAMCRSSLTTVSAAACAEPKAPDETIAAARRRVALARTKSDSVRRSPSGRTQSHRRIRTGRAPAIRATGGSTAVLSERAPSRAGLVAAAVAVFFAAFAIFTAVRDGSTPSDEPTTTQKPTTPSPAPTIAPPAPAQPEQQAPVPPSEDVVAQANPTPLPPVEEEPAEAPVPGPAPQQPDVTTPAPAPATPQTATKPEPQPTRPQPSVLACKVDEVTGPVEIRPRFEKSWRRLTVAELVHDGDALRSLREDGSIKLANKARITFNPDATGTVTIKDTGVCVALESGSLDGESLSYDGLEVREANGFVTAWKGSKVRVESTAKGLHVVVERGTANAGNELGKVTVHAGHELTLVKDRRPVRPTTR